MAAPPTGFPVRILLAVDDGEPIEVGSAEVPMTFHLGEDGEVAVKFSQDEVRGTLAKVARALAERFERPPVTAP